MRRKRIEAELGVFRREAEEFHRIYLIRRPSLRAEGEATQKQTRHAPGLLRYARNDDRGSLSAVLVGRLYLYHSAIIMRVIVTAVTIDVRMPRPIETAKPRTRTGTQKVEDRGGDEHRDVGIDDGREGPLEAGVERLG